MMKDINVLRNCSAQFGDGFYLVSEKRINSIYKHFCESFSLIYPNSQVAFSLKTCYVRTVLKKLVELGSFAEVTSEFEYELAKKMGYTDDKMVYNGPYKKMDVVHSIAASGGIVNVDSKSEAMKICQTKGMQGLSVGIRCNANVDGRSSRFGIYVDSDDMHEVIKMLLRHGIGIKGFMCHIRTKTLEDWDKKVSTMTTFVKAITHEMELQDVEFIDFGGGYRYDESMFSKYASIIVNHVKNIDQRNIRIILEPGAAICEGTIDYYAKVVNTNIINRTKYVTIAATMCDISAIRRRVPSRVEYVCDERMKEIEQYDKQVVAGFTCLEDDIIIDEVPISLSEGDFIGFENVGAYSESLRPTFIRGCPAVLYENEKGDILIDSYAEGTSCLIK